MLTLGEVFPDSKGPKQVSFCDPRRKSLEPVLEDISTRVNFRMLKWCHFTHAPTYAIKSLSHTHTPSGPSCQGVRLAVIVSIMGASLLPRDQFVIECASATKCRGRAQSQEYRVSTALRFKVGRSGKKCLQQQDLKCHLWASSHLPL